MDNLLCVPSCALEKLRIRFFHLNFHFYLKDFLLFNNHISDQELNFITELKEFLSQRFYPLTHVRINLINIFV